MSAGKWSQPQTLSHNTAFRAIQSHRTTPCSTTINPEVNPVVQPQSLSLSQHHGSPFQDVCPYSNAATCSILVPPFSSQSRCHAGSGGKRTCSSLDICGRTHQWIGREHMFSPWKRCYSAIPLGMLGLYPLLCFANSQLLRFTAFACSLVANCFPVTSQELYPLNSIQVGISRRCGVQ